MIGLNKTYCELNLETMSRMPDNCLDSIVTDPPYGLKFMGKKFGFHVITAAQMGRADIRRLREEGTDATFDSTAVKDSQEVASHAEFIFALTKIPDESDRLRLHVVKSRYGGDGFTETLGLIADRCRIMSTTMQMASLGDEPEDFIDHFEKHTEEAAEKALKSQKELQWPDISLDDIDTTGVS